MISLISMIMVILIITITSNETIIIPMIITKLPAPVIATDTTNN